jgi:hypothetical protein
MVFFCPDFLFSERRVKMGTAKMMVLVLCLGLGILGSALADPVLLTELNDGANPAYQMCLWGDGSTVFFDRYVPELGHFGIFQANWTFPHGTLSNVRLLTELNSGGDFSCPRISADGLRLYYMDTMNGQYYIRMAQRAAVGDTWLPGQIFSTIHLSGWQDAHQTLTGDELTMYWNRYKTGSGAYILKATRSNINEPFSNPVRVNELNTNSWIGGAYILPDDKTIYYNSNDLYRATRSSLSQPFGNITPLDVNTPNYPEWSPYVTLDQQYLYFYSNRGSQGNGIWLIPEPASMALFFLGGSLLMRRRRI